MIGKNALFVVIISAMLLSGCASDASPGGSSGGTGSSDGGTGGLANPSAITTENGAILTMKDVVTADCESGVDCIGILLEAENPTASSVRIDPWTMYHKERIVDADGNEHSIIDCALLDEIDLRTDLSPGAKREGYFCFNNTGGDAKFYFGFNNDKNETAFFSITQSSVRTLAKSASMEMPGDNYRYGYAGGRYCLSKVFGSITNTGEAPLRLKMVQENISGGTITVDLAAGETKNFTIGKADRERLNSVSFMEGPIYGYVGPGCWFAGNVSKQGGTVWATASDSLGKAGELAKKGIEVTSCGYVDIETWEETEYVPYWGERVVTKSKDVPQPCCPGDFCAEGVCQNGMCVSCGYEDQPCCDAVDSYDGCRDYGLDKRTCVEGTCKWS